jgi:hypothetical protein
MNFDSEVYARAVEVAGAYFRYADALAFINASEPKGLTLELEPTNKYDPNAIRVNWGRKHVGYVPAPLAKAIYMDNVEDRVSALYRDSYVDDSGPGNPRLRIVFDIVIAKDKASGLTKSREEVLK